MVLYADGVQVGKDNGKWFMSKIYKLPANTKAVAIRGMNTLRGPAGIIGSFSSGLVTDASWRCTKDYTPGWESAEFDDSTWPHAVEFQRGTVLSGPKIASEAKWIWTSKYSDWNVYCRSVLGQCFMFIIQ